MPCFKYSLAPEHFAWLEQAFEWIFSRDLGRILYPRYFVFHFFLKGENFFNCLRNIVEISFPNIKTQQIGNWLNEIKNRLINMLLNSCWHFVSNWLFTLLFKVHQGKIVISWMTSSNYSVCHSYALVCHPHLHVCHSYVTIMPFVCTRMLLT